MCREWYTLLLEPWVHYVPVDYHFKRLHDAAAWVSCNATLPHQVPTLVQYSGWKMKCPSDHF